MPTGHPQALGEPRRAARALRVERSPLAVGGAAGALLDREACPRRLRNPRSGAWSYPEARGASVDGKPMLLGRRQPVVAAGRAGKASSTSLFEDEENRGCDVPIEGKTRMLQKGGDRWALRDRGGGPPQVCQTRPPTGIGARSQCGS
ncbi:hypothetical protein B0H17DRAFT_1185542 [Mycena rosella]|uniref:Uncharacterized protein n=1 Tax=Mycena rosella TaxID=1033263 RepID=A0AAD7CR61_MYCRO|nr:hypothetical protein B0H17DRAFT_1185542 [Mycena rosella]